MIIDLDVVYNDFTKIEEITNTTAEKVAVVVWVGSCRKWRPMVYDITGVVNANEHIERMIRGVLYDTAFRLKIIKHVDNVYFCDVEEK